MTQAGKPHNDGCAFTQTNRGGTSRARPDLSKVHCYGCGQFGHRKRDGKCDPAKKAEWQKKNGQSTAHTVKHMSTDAPTEDDSDQGIYCVAMCMTDAVSEENTGKIVIDNGGSEIGMANPFDADRALVIPSVSVGLYSKWAT